MSDSKDSTKDSEKSAESKSATDAAAQNPDTPNASPAEAVPEEALLTVEELDQVIQAEDPEFADSLVELEKETLHLLGDEDDHMHLNAGGEILPWKDRIKQGILNSIHIFRDWSFFQKLTFLIILVCLPALGFYFSFVFKKGYIHANTQVFVNSMQEWSDQKYEWNTANPEEVDQFYGSLHLPIYVYNLKKMIVNLKTVPHSASNAMIAIELVAEGTTPDVVTEIKEREEFFRDVFQQELSQISYEGVSDPEGKNRMLARLRRVMNESVTKGKVKKLYLKNLILKQ